MRVTYYQRSIESGAFSVERVFADVRRVLPEQVVPSVAFSPHNGTSLLCLLKNMREARAFQGDVNHVTGDITYLGSVLNPRSTIVTFHDLGRVYSMSVLKAWIFDRLWIDLPIRRCRIVTAVSYTTGRRLVNRFPHAAPKLRVVHDPVSRNFQYAPKPFCHRQPVILQVGTLKHKNLDRLIRALAGIRCKLSIVGKPDDEQLGLLNRFKIDFTANWNLTDESIVEKYRECDMLVFASLHEGFGLPIVEAQATGRPVLTSDLEPMIEVAGGGACLVNPFDVASIRSGILEVIHDADYRRSLVETGLCNIQRFEPSAIARTYARLYEEICESR